MILDNQKEENFQLSIFTEIKFLYVVEHDKNSILRIFEIELSKTRPGEFFLKYYYYSEGKTIIDYI
jgi:hypothetical protein